MSKRDYCNGGSYDGRCGVTTCKIITPTGNCGVPPDLGLCNDCMKIDEKCARNGNKVHACEFHEPLELVKKLEKIIGGKL